MKRSVLLLILVTLVIFSCRKQEKSSAPDCSMVRCAALPRFDLRIRLMDGTGKNLVYGPDARIPTDSITLYYYQSKLVWTSSPDSVNATGYMSASLLAIPAMMSMQPGITGLTIPVTLKIKSAAGENIYLLTTKSNGDCCTNWIEGLYVNKVNVFYKPEVNSSGPSVINIPVGL